MKKIGLLLIFVTMACSTVPSTDPASVDHNGPTNGPGSYQESRDYKSILNSWTKKDQAYNNFSAAYQVTAVLLSREVVEAQVKLDAERFNWSQEEIEKARQKALDDLQTQTTFLLSLYTDKDEDNNLEKANPAWNLFLDVNGKHVPPQSVKRIYENRVSLLQKYPVINIWSRNYYVKFPVPSDDASTNNTLLTLAGPLGSAHLKFK
jgi:hypothetical protein